MATKNHEAAEYRVQAQLWEEWLSNADEVTARPPEGEPPYPRFPFTKGVRRFPRPDMLSDRVADMIEGHNLKDTLHLDQHHLLFRHVIRGSPLSKALRQYDRQLCLRQGYASSHFSGKGINDNGIFYHPDGPEWLALLPRTVTVSLLTGLALHKGPHTGTNYNKEMFQVLSALEEKYKSFVDVPRLRTDQEFFRILRDLTETVHKRLRRPLALHETNSKKSALFLHSDDQRPGCPGASYAHLSPYNGHVASSEEIEGRYAILRQGIVQKHFLIRENKAKPCKEQANRQALEYSLLNFEKHWLKTYDEAVRRRLHKLDRLIDIAEAHEQAQNAKRGLAPLSGPAAAPPAAPSAAPSATPPAATPA